VDLRDEVLQGITKFLKADNSVAVRVNLLDNVCPFPVVFQLMLHMEVDGIQRFIFKSLLRLYGNSNLIARLKKSLLVAGRQSLLELLNVDRAVSVDVECVECILDVLLGEHLLMVDSSSVEFLKVYLSVSIEVTVFQNIVPFITDSRVCFKFLVGL
jgi:hypothetical protein